MYVMYMSDERRCARPKQTQPFACPLGQVTLGKTATDPGKPMNERALLFVYGSLRRDSGHAMSAWLAARADWLGPAFVAGQLFRVHWYPGLVTGAGHVRGDLYRLHDADAVLAELDAYEEIRQLPEDEYRREYSAVETASAEVLQAWVYWYRLSAADLAEVPEGDWLAAEAEQLAGDKNSER